MTVETDYDPALVILSIAIAIFASYTALDLGSRVRAARQIPRWAWISGAALAMGGGIWSMHFVGMLAFRLPMPVAYASDLTILSFLIAVVATGAAFAYVSRSSAQKRDVLVGGVLMGAAVASMHYTGMAAMRMPGALAYSLPIVILSVAIAVTAATVALWLTMRDNTVWQKMVAAVVMGAAVAGMHYTGMAAASFSDAAMSAGMTGHMTMHGVGHHSLALTVAGATFVILFLGMLASSVEQQRTRLDLAASEQRFRAAAEAVGDIIWTNDPDGRMRGSQRDWQAYTGQSEAECQGFGWSKAIHPDDIAPTLDAWNAAVAARRTAAFEHRVRRRDGVYRLFSVRAVPVLDANGRLCEWVGVHEDITERREAETALEAARDAAEQANLAKSTFLANMSHELRTPLSAIIGYSEMMAEEIADGCAATDLASDMAKVESNARHLLGLINDMLDLSKIESGKMEVFAEDFPVEPVVRAVAETVDALVTKGGNRLEVVVAPGLGSIHSDVTKIRQVLLNLLSNAAKFTQGGIITVTAAAEPGGDRVVFTVSDTGIGMTPEHISRLFQRFTQADSSTTRKYGGTGLGLSLTKAFVDMLGGEVRVDSALGRGTTFTVALPMGLPASPSTITTPEAEPADDLGRELVLVIDDDDDQRALMTRFLHREGFRARTAPDGTSGLALARELKPRAILLDVMMPGVDGWSVLSALKADPELNQIPVVMVTFVEQRALAASLGAADYVLKPVRWDRFQTVMDRFRPPARDVLLIDDDPDVRTQVRKALERSGWRVSEAADGQQGLEMLRHAKPEIVLLDVSMPVLDGFGFLERLRATAEHADTPVIVLTARDLTVEDRRRLRGASQILHKGDVSMHALAERLHSVSAEVREEPPVAAVA